MYIKLTILSDGASVCGALGKIVLTFAGCFTLDTFP